VKKWVNELNRVFSKEEVQMAKKHMKKMLNIPGHKGNANQNHIKIPPRKDSKMAPRGRKQKA
jgi:hypothetical protein